MTQNSDLDIENFEPSDAPNTKRTKGTQNGGLSVVCTEKHGNRIGLNQAHILDYLSDPDRIQISFSDRYVAIGTYISEENPTYNIGRSGKNGVLYNSGLVRKIVRRFDLDFSERSSRTYPVFEIQEYDTGNIVFIDMLPEEDTNEYEEAELDEVEDELEDEEVEE